MLVIYQLRYKGFHVFHGMMKVCIITHTIPLEVGYILYLIDSEPVLLLAITWKECTLYCSHNQCRNPDGDVNGPWCYINEIERKWGYCHIPLCNEPENEFIRAQTFCGQRPALLESTCRKERRVIGGRPALVGEAPYQIRLRYFKVMKFGSQLSDHQCGGTLISSCWAVTAAHCIPTGNWYRNSGAKFWLRVDVGNRYYQAEWVNYGWVRSIWG